MNSAAPPAASSDSRLVQVLDAYLAALQAGTPPSKDELLARYPELADDLEACLASLEFIRQGAVQARLGEAAREPLPAASLVSGVLGDYRILREVGRGGMGVVYEAEQVSLGRRVALKVLPFAAALDSKQLQRFKNEAQAAAHLHHQNIVPVYAVGCERGVHFYAMQYIDGQTVAALIHELRQMTGLEQPQRAGSARLPSALASQLASGSWAPAKPPGGEEVGWCANQDLPSPQQATTPSPHHPATAPLADVTPPVAMGSTERSTTSPAYFRTVANLGIQAAQALEHAHQLGIVHRDIKPANLLVDVRGNLWITDFGLAHCQSQAGLTMTGDLVGTLRYMSPEQAQGKRLLIDHRTDIYSLGVTLHELLTLEPVFRGSDRGVLLQQIAFEEPLPPRQRNKAIPRELETIVLKAIEKSPEARYPTAQELADDLRRYLEDKPIRAKRPTLWQRAAKWARRHKTVVWAAVLLLVFAVIALGVSTFLIMQERDVAQANSHRAEQILDTAYRTLDKMYLDWAEKRFAHAKEITPENRQFLEDALALYMEFANHNSSAPAGRQKTAEAYLRVATIQAQLGQDAEAERNYQHGLQALRRLAAEFPNNADYRSSLARCLTREGDDALHPPDFTLHSPHFGGTAQPEEDVREAITLQERLVAEDPTRTKYQRDLAESYGVLGDYADDHERLEEAEQLYRSACRLLARLAKEHPTVMVYRKEFCDRLGCLGNIVRKASRMQEAEVIMYESLEHRKKLVADFPGLPQPRFCLSYGYTDLAQWQWTSWPAPWSPRYTGAAYQNGVHWQWDARRFQAAAEAYRRALEIQAKLASDFPSVPLYRVEVAKNYFALAMVLSQFRQVPEAEQLCRDALAMGEALARDHPTLVLYAFRVAQTQMTLGRLVSDRGEPAAALAWLDQAIAACQKVCATEPHARNWLTSAHAFRAIALVGLRRFPEAEQAFQELERIYAEALAGDPANIVNWICAALLRLQRGDREGYHRVCRDMLARFGHMDDPTIAALVAHTWLVVPVAAGDLAPILQLADRATSGTEQNFDYCWFQLAKGMADYRAGHFDQAVDRLNQTLSLGREDRYLNTRPLTGMAHAFLAMAHQRLGRAAQARRALTQAKELMEEPSAKIGWNGSAERAWHNWLRFYLVYQEAAALVNGEVEPGK